MGVLATTVGKNGTRVITPRGQLTPTARRDRIDENCHAAGSTLLALSLEPARTVTLGLHPGLVSTT